VALFRYSFALFPTPRRHVDEQKEHEAANSPLQSDRLRHRLHAMYVNKLDEPIDGALYGQISEQWRAEQNGRLRFADS
jgi:hypothetical protein